MTKPAARRTAEARRLVLAVGPQAETAATEVARRRRCEVVRLGRVEEVAERLERGGAETAFVVADASDVGFEALLAVARAGAEAPDLALGVLYGRGGRELLGAARRLPPEAPVAAAASPQSLFAAPDQPATLEGARLVARNPGRTAPEVVARRLLEPSELTFLVGHANAQHLTVGGAVLCRRSRVQVDPGELRVYPCFHGDPCHFAPNRGEREVAVDGVQARRVIAVSCYGASFADLPFASAFSIGEGLLRHAGVETLITAVRAATVSTADLAILYYLVNSGLPLGAVAARANRFRLAAGQAPEWFCFGDPESRVEASLVPVPCRRKDGWLVLDPGADRGAPRDLVAELPPGELPEEPILLDESAGDLLSAALEPGGRIYVTVPADWKERPVRLRVAGRGELVDEGGTAAALAADLAFLDLYLPLLAASGGDTGAVAAALRGLQELLWGWPLAEYPACTRLEGTQLRALWRELRRRVETLGARFVSLYRDVMVPDQRTHPSPWDSRFRTVRREPAARGCAYCGHPMDEFEMEARLGRARRRWGLCRNACAYVWDGDPGLGRFLEVTDPLEPGAEAAFSVTAANPYGIPLDAFGAGVLKHFENGRSQPGRVARTELVPGRPGRVDLRLQVPAALRPGTYHLSACLMVGARFNFYRAQVRVTSPGKASHDADGYELTRGRALPETVESSPPARQARTTIPAEGIGKEAPRCSTCTQPT